MQAPICLITSLWLARVLVVRYLHKKSLTNSVLMALGLLAGAAHLAGFVWICHHYAMPLTDAYDLCVHELSMLARHYGMTYYIVNYVIFIAAFLLLTVGNLAAAELLRSKPAKEQHDSQSSC